jgi:hypothetical protein
MVEMALWGTRIRFLHLFVHLIGGDFANVEGEESSGHCSLRGQSGGSSIVTFCLFLFGVKRLGSILNSMRTTSALGCCSLGACAQRLPNCHRQN